MEDSESATNDILTEVESNHEKVFDISNLDQTNDENNKDNSDEKVV